MSEDQVVVSGAAGFIGTMLCTRFAASGRPFRGLVRALTLEAAKRRPLAAVGDLATVANDALEALLEGAAAVVHLAGRAHVMGETSEDADGAYHAQNVVATERLARAALRAGVRRFVYASTVKVHGEASPPGKPFSVDDPPAPADAYARSKLAAETALQTICSDTWMTPLILRLPLVYGPGVKGNFLTLFEAVARRAWLPFGAIRNRRDLLYAGNLVAVIEALIDEPRPVAGTWLLSDGESLSTRDLCWQMAAALETSPRIVAVPVPVLEIGAKLAGRLPEFERLTRWLEVDSAPIWTMLGSTPYTLRAGLAETARWWRLHHAI